MKNKCKWLLETIADFYIIIILLFFPLLIGKDGYNNILTVKYYSYLFIAITYIAINVLILLYFLIIKKTNYFKEIKLKNLKNI